MVCSHWGKEGLLCAFSFKICCVAIKKMNIFRPNVDMGKEVVIHEGVVGLRVIPREPDVLVL